VILLFLASRRGAGLIKYRKKPFQFCPRGRDGMSFLLHRRGHKLGQLAGNG
jgi:hypothetical protein